MENFFSTEIMNNSPLYNKIEYKITMMFSAHGN